MKIDWDGIKDAIVSASNLAQYYLDLETGKAVFVSEMDPETDEVTPDELDENPDRYVLIEPPPSRITYQWMAEFAEAVRDGALAGKLLAALEGKGAFRRFKNVLLNYPGQREAWFRFEDAKVNEAVRRWVESSGIEADNPCPWGNREKG